MDKKTKTQVSLVLLIIGLIMLFIPYLKYFDSIVPGISQSFNLYVLPGTRVDRDRLLSQIIKYAREGKNSPLFFLVFGFVRLFYFFNFNFTLAITRAHCPDKPCRVSLIEKRHSSQG